MTDQQRIEILETRLADKEQALQSAFAEIDALRQQETENAEIIGDLIVRMVHDMNNLNTKIRSSSTTITHALSDVRGILVTIILHLTPDQQQAFLDLAERAWQEKSQATGRVSLREERRLRRALHTELEAQKLPDVDDMADVLVDMGIYAGVQPFLPLLKDERQEELLQAIYGLVSLHDVVQWNLNPAFGRIVHITHTLRHMIVALLENRLREVRIVPGIEQVLLLFGDVLERRRIDVVTHYDDIPGMWCYAGLEIVWAGLIENAIEAIGEDGTLEVYVVRQGTEVLARITDSGGGIPNAIRARLFERDVTTKPSGSDIHGAGLYLVRKIVRKHQGRIEFETQPGRTSFSVRLPFRRNA